MGRHRPSPVMNRFSARLSSHVGYGAQLCQEYLSSNVGRSSRSSRSIASLRPNRRHEHGTRSRTRSLDDLYDLNPAKEHLERLELSSSNHGNEAAVLSKRSGVSSIVHSARVA